MKLVRGIKKRPRGYPGPLVEILRSLRSAVNYFFFFGAAFFFAAAFLVAFFID